MPTFKPAIDQKVTYTDTDDGGSFDGVITGVSESVVVITPDNDALSRYFGGRPFRLGRAHWDARLKVRN